MTNEQPDKLDRIEALLEKIAQRTDSNARSIEALSNERFEAERRLDRDRVRLYQAMADLATSQANLASSQALYYQRLEETDRRQNQIVEILRLLTNRIQDQ